MGFVLMKSYIQKIQEAMLFLSKKKKAIFLGQSVKYPGSSIFESLKTVPKNKKIELPVFEDVQMGLTLGLALEEYFPISCYPRYDFLILGLNQLVNHLDKVNYLTNNSFKSRIFIRTMIGARKPLNAGPQHTQDITNGLKKILTYIKIIHIKKNSNIIKIFKNALSDKKKIILFVEDGNNYSG
jgi:pyruvate/2-oxoglutarate/acetoin dehydrogenase E1 component